MVSQLNLTTKVALGTEKVVVAERFQQQAMYGLSAIKKKNGHCRDVAAVAERWPLIDVPLYVNLNTLC